MGKKNIAYINNEMLIWARKQSPFKNAQEVEQRFIDIKSIELEKWENGEEFPSVNQAKRLAEIYKLPFASFYYTNLPKENPKPYKDRRTFWGTQYDEPSYELWSEIKRIQDEREMSLEFLDEELISCTHLPKFDSTTNINEVAKEMRKYLDLPKFFKNKELSKSEGYKYFREKFEARGIIVEQINGVDLEEIKALSIYEEILPIIAINSKDYKRSKTFSLFHELAHLIRRSSSLCTFDDNEREDNEEKICDQIASSILMEEETFINQANILYSKYGEWNEISLRSLGNKFGVSLVAAFRRLYDLNLITSDYYFTQYDEIKENFNEYLTKNKNKDESREYNIPYYVKYLSQHGELIPKLVMNAHYKGEISFGEICRIFDLKSNHIENIGQTVMGR